MFRKEYCFLLIYLFTSITTAQTWERLYDMGASTITAALAVTKDSCFVATTGSYGGFRVIKVNRFGDTLWRRIIGSGSSGCWEANRIIEASNGNLVVCGTRDLGPRFLSLTMINPFGETLWSRIFRPDTREVWGTSVRQTPEGDFVAVGYLWYPYLDCYAVKTDSLGNLIWQKVYPSNDEEVAIDVLAIENYYLVLAKRIPFEILILKLNQQGDILETRNYSFPQLGRGLNGIHISQTSDGYLITGSISPNNSQTSAYLIVKIDTLLNVQWVRVYKLTSQRDVAKRGWQTENGYWVAGTIDETNYSPGPQKICLLRLNLQGESLYSRTYFSGYYGTRCYDAGRTWDNGVIVLGLLCNPAGNPYVYLVRTNSQGLVGLEEMAQSPKLQLPTRIFPNPSSAVNFLNENENLVILNTSGQKITKRNLSAGIYFVLPPHRGNGKEKIKIIILRP